MIWKKRNPAYFSHISTAVKHQLPGQGKSVLSNFVIDHLAEQQIPGDKVIYYFCNIKNEESSWTVYSRIYYIIDGLDVYGTEMTSLLKYLKDYLILIPYQEPFLKLLWTSTAEGFVMDLGFEPTKTLRASEDDLALFIDFELGPACDETANKDTE
ncbi:hypothetical protein ACMFMG_006807 [Clarireedia jacksonii]